MRREPGDWNHLLRLAALGVVAALAFVALRAVAIPASFGQYGHYRGDAIAEARTLPVRHGARADCTTCHDDVAAAQKAAVSRHAPIGCETCHGPLAAHVDDPTSMTPPAVDAAALCIRCHARAPGRPARVPQVIVAEHAGDEPCGTCHTAHVPRP
jgi:hypothetical protein